jgi:hypothetical protein
MPTELKHGLIDFQRQEYHPKPRMTTDLDSRGNRIPILVGFIIHLLVPLALCLDVLKSWKFVGVMNLSDKAVLALSALWLAIGIGVLLVSGGGKRFLGSIGKSLLTIYTVFLTLALLELSARIFVQEPQPTLFSPGAKYVMHPNPRLFPGVDESINFTVNEVGLRGPALPHADNVFKIVTIGGSTTGCANEDDSREWPRLLMENMSAGQRKRVVWVANAGLSGHTTVHHLMLLQTLPILSQVDMLTFLVGYNDLQASIAFGGGSTEESLDHDAELFREQILAGVGQAHPWYRRLRLFQLSHKAALALLSRRDLPRLVQRLPIDPVEMRRRRGEAPVAPLPDLRAGLQEYRDHLLGIVRECQNRRLRCVFLTQPTMWRDNLTPAEQGLLWGAYVGRIKSPQGYLSVADAARAMDTYNRELLNLCDQNNMECYDLASYIPKDSSAFYDDDHFTDNGSRMVARFISDHLLAAPPFNGRSPKTRLPAAKTERSQEVDPDQSTLKKNP